MKTKTKNWITEIIRRIFGINEIINELKSANEKLAKFEKCIRPGIKHRENTSHIVTGHWND